MANYAEHIASLRVDEVYRVDVSSGGKWRLPPPRDEARLELVSTISQRAFLKIVETLGGETEPTESAWLRSRVPAEAEHKLMSLITPPERHDWFSSQRDT